MTVLLNFLVAGVGVGVLYGLLALPLSFVAAATGILDIAVGGYAVIGGLTAVGVGGLHGVAAGIGFGVLASLLVAGLYQIAVRQGRADAIAFTVIGVGVLFALQSLAQVVFGGDPMRVHAFQDRIAVGGPAIAQIDLIAIGVVVAIVGALLVVLYRTRLGREMRAVADDEIAAQLMGIPARAIQVGVFAVGGLLAGIAGVVLVVTRGMAYSDGLPLSLVAFLALVVLGVSGPVRAVLGGVFVGVLEALSIGYLPAQIATAAPLLGILVLLSTGLVTVGALEKA